VNALEGAVSFPDKISERAGLDIVQKIQADTEFGSRLRAALIEVASTDVAAEQAVIKSILASSSKPEKKALHKVMGSDMDAGEEVLGNLQGVRVSRLPNGALILSGAGVTDAFAQKLMAWLVE
jgi:ParB family chromosome partitioning protein